MNEIIRAAIETYVLDTLSNGTADNLLQYKNIKLLNLIIGYSHHIAELMRCIKNEDVMFHEAAIANITPSIRNLMFAHDVSVILALSLLRTAHSISIKRFVLASSAAAYGLILIAIF